MASKRKNQGREDMGVVPRIVEIPADQLCWSVSHSLFSLWLCRRRSRLPLSSSRPHHHFPPCSVGPDSLAPNFSCCAPLFDLSTVLVFFFSFPVTRLASHIHTHTLTFSSIFDGFPHQGKHHTDRFNRKRFVLTRVSARLFSSTSFTCIFFRSSMRIRVHFNYTGKR
jgi:hypothetical protein